MKPIQRFAGKVIVVTGASSGIGAASARVFAAEGGHVVLVARSVEPLERIAAEIRGAGGRARAMATNVGDSRAAAALLDRVASELGGIDVLVNNAGVNYRGAVEERNAQELAEIIAVNLTAPILMSQAVLPHLRKRGGGAIVNVASLAGRVPLPHEATYAASKWGLRGFSFSLAEELAGSGIRVSVVSPGPVDTGFIMSKLAEVPDVVFSQPMSTAEQIATLVVDSAHDGERERLPSRASGYLTTFAYLFPRLRQSMTPLFERRGRVAKQKYIERAAGRTPR
jgi:short-subunit dehydrogenase